jgi:putative zinc finger/helix-turn-helix YgiT family protein
MEKMTDHNCMACRVEKFATDEQPFHFVDSGLPNVYLVGIKYFVCECGNVVAEIPAVKQLMRLIARDLVESNTSLTSKEIRFLRKRLGRRANEFAKELGIEPEHLSRLENGKHPIPEPMDKLIRLIYAVSAGDPDLLKDVMRMVKSWLVTWSKRTANLKIVKRIDDDNEWSNALAA